MRAGNGRFSSVQKVNQTLQYLLTVSTTQIIVRKHDDRRTAQVWSEDTLAAGVERVAIDEGDCPLSTCHGFGCCMTPRPIRRVLRFRGGTAAGTSDWPSAE